MRKIYVDGILQFYDNAMPIRLFVITKEHIEEKEKNISFQF